MNFRQTMQTMRWMTLVVGVPVLLGFSGCVAAEVGPLPDRLGAVFDTNTSVDAESKPSVHRVELPEEWNGRFIVLFTNTSSRTLSDWSAQRVRLAWSELVATGYAVAEVEALPDPSPGPVHDNHPHVHLVLSMGFSQGVYLVGVSHGMEIALVTVMVDQSGPCAVPELVSPGFVRASTEGFSVTAVEEVLASDEPSATILAYRLQTNRSELARTLVGYYSLLSDLHQHHTGRFFVPGVFDRDAPETFPRVLRLVS